MKKYFIVRSRATPGLGDFITPLTSDAIYAWLNKQWVPKSNSIVIPPTDLKMIVDLLYSKFGVSNIFCTMIFFSKDIIIISAIIPSIGLISAVVKITHLQSLQRQVVFKIAESVEHEEKLAKLHIPMSCKDEILACIKQIDQTVEIFPFKNR